MSLIAGGSSTRGGGGLSIGRFKGSFFDAAPVLKAMDKADRKAQSKFGAFVRTSARTSIKYRADVAAPGQPPSGHKTISRAKKNRKTGVTKVQQVSPLREFIYFAYDAPTHSTVIGPALLAGKGRDGGKTIPEALERGGGRRTVLEVLRRGKWMAAFSRAEWERSRRSKRKRSAAVAQHPFMQPALETNIPKFAPLYANSLR